VGPGVVALDERLRTARNPLYHSALAVTESVPDGADVARLEAAQKRDPQDRDLVYLVGAARKRAGRYEDAAGALPPGARGDPQDAVARNNLANIEFVRGSYDSARRVTGRDDVERSGGGGDLVLQPLARAPAEVRVPGLQHGQVERRPPRAGLVSDYDRWRYDTGDYAVVDLGLTKADVWDKFRAPSPASRPATCCRGRCRRPSLLPGALLNRFAVALLIFALAGCCSRAGAVPGPSRSTAAAAERPSAGSATSAR
jgi:hypothetical protein